MNSSKSFKKIVVLPDIHTPNHNRLAMSAVIKFLRFYKPDVLVQLGDFCDWDSVSTYDVRRSSDVVTIETEIREANFLLDEIDKAVPKLCRKVMIGGNHEARYARFIANNGFTLAIRRMKEFSSWQIEYGLGRRGWEDVDYGEHVQIGKIIFTHGWFNFGPKRMGEKFPGRNVIFGHTHRHEVYGWIDERDRPIESETIGTLSEFDLSYLNGCPPTNWVTGFQYIDMMDDGTFSKHFVHIIDGGFIEFGRYFGP